MPILIACSSCGIKLKAPDDARGRKFKCAKCGAIVVVPGASAPASSPASTKPKPQPAIVTKATKPQEDFELVEPLPDETPPETAKPKRKKKKRRRIREETQAGVPRWLWWWGSLAAAGVLTGIGLVAMGKAGYPFMALYCAFSLMFALPINTIVFAFSMFLSSWFGAGLELTEFSILIPKALLLVLFASIAGLMPCFGGWIALGIWFIGAMVLFELEAWETRFLVGINWVLGWAMRLFLIGLLVSLVHGAPDAGKDRPGNQPPAVEQDNDG